MLNGEVLSARDCIVGQSALVSSPKLRPIFKALTAVDETIFINDWQMFGRGSFSDFDATKEVCGGILFLDVLSQRAQVKIALKAGAESCKVVVNDFCVCGSVMDRKNGRLEILTLR